MATLQEIMARNAAVRAAKESEALPPSPIQKLREASLIVTGMQSMITAADTVVALPPVAVLDETKKAAALAVYKDLNLRHFVSPSIRKVKAIDGYFYAETVGEMETLEVHAQRGRVERVEAPEEE